jgi:accessory gene regulator protein AgrB
MFTYLLFGYLSRFIPVYPFHIYVLALASISSLIIFYRVPVDNPACIISDRSQRNKYKIKTGMVLVIILGLTIVIHYLYKKPVAVAVLLGLLWQNFALLPWGQSYVQMWDRFFVKIERQIIMKGG